MPAPYSMDLRKKIVEVYKREKISHSKLALRFSISASSVSRYINLDKTDELAPKKGAKGRPGKLDDKGYEIIKKAIEKNPTITLEELSELFYKKKKIAVGNSILSRACKKLELNRKKLSRYALEREREDVKKNAKNI